MPRTPDPVDPATSPWHLLGATIRHWRGERSQRELAGLVHIDGSLISLYERGEARPHPDTVRMLDRATGAGGQLTALHATVAELERLRARESRRRQTGTGQANPSSDGEADEMERRALLHLLTALGAGAVIPADAVETLRLAADRALGDRDDSDVDEWEQIVAEYGHALVTVPRTRLLGDLAVDVVQMRSALDRAADPNVRVGLQRCHAYLSAATAMALLDSGQPRAAWRWWRTARRAADVSGDRDTAVWMRAREAINASVGGRPPAVATSLTDSAIGMAGGAPSAGLIRAYDNRALTAARAGDSVGARIALDALADVAERMPSSSADPLSQWTWSENSIWSAMGQSYAVLGDAARAEPAIGRALEHIPPERHGARISARLWKALCLIRGGAVNEGLAHTWQALEEAPAYNLMAIRKMDIGDIVAALPNKARHLDAARALSDLIAT